MMFGVLLDDLGAIFCVCGAMLERSSVSWGDLGSIWGCVRLTWAYFGAMIKLFRCSACGYLGRSWVLWG